MMMLLIITTLFHYFCFHTLYFRLEYRQCKFLNIKLWSSLIICICNQLKLKIMNYRNGEKFIRCVILITCQYFLTNEGQWGKKTHTHDQTCLSGMRNFPSNDQNYVNTIQQIFTFCVLFCCVLHIPLTDNDLPPRNFNGPRKLPLLTIRLWIAYVHWIISEIQCEIVQLIRCAAVSVHTLEKFSIITLTSGRIIWIWLDWYIQLQSIYDPF